MTSTSTPIPTNTPTPYPTLSPTQVEANLIELLETNAGCQFPCLWGITPGLTRWHDAEKFLVSKGLSLSLDYIAQPPNYYDTLVTHDGIFAKILFYEQNEIVEAIELNGEGVYAPEIFEEMWGQYAPENILPTYGPPSRILVYAHPGRTSEGKLMYSLWFFYDQQGFLIHYGGRTESLPTLKLCPTFKESGNLTPLLSIYLKSPNFKSTLESLTVIPDNPQPYINLEEAADISMDEFYALFQQQANPICVDVPRNIWE